MQIITLKEFEFDDFATKNKYESIYQTSSYANTQIRKGFNVHYLGFQEDNGEMVGAAMVLYKKLFWNYSYAYIPRGLLIDYDNPYLVKKITIKLKKLLYKQNFIFVKIDPPVIASERDKEGNIEYFSNTVNDIVKTLKSNDYKHKGFNLYNETKLPRWNALIKLDSNIDNIYDKFDSEKKELIRDAKRLGVEAYRDNNYDLDKIFGIIQKSIPRLPKGFVDSLNKCYGDNLDIWYSSVNTNKFTKNSNTLYNKEEEKNNQLSLIISSNDTYKYDIQKVISDKMISDRELNKLKKSVIDSTKLLQLYPDGIIGTIALSIKHTEGVDIIILATDKDTEKYNTEAILIYEMCKYYREHDYKYIILGPATGNFEPNNSYYKQLKPKLGYNTSIIEYIGEFDLIINPLMYKVYQYKNNKNKKKSK